MLRIGNCPVSSWMSGLNGVDMNQPSTGQITSGRLSFGRSVAISRTLSILKESPYSRSTKDSPRGTHTTSRARSTVVLWYQYFPCLPSAWTTRFSGNPEYDCWMNALSFVASASAPKKSHSGRAIRSSSERRESKARSGRTVSGQVSAPTRTIPHHEYVCDCGSYKSACGAYDQVVICLARFPLPTQYESPSSETSSSFDPRGLLWTCSIADSYVTRKYASPPISESRYLSPHGVSSKIRRRSSSGRPASIACTQRAQSRLDLSPQALMSPDRIVSCHHGGKRSAARIRTE